LFGRYKPGTVKDRFSRIKLNTLAFPVLCEFKQYLQSNRHHFSMQLAPHF